jgi:hypothetical protein
MRVDGSSDGCLHAARQLRRAAAEIGGTTSRLDPLPPLEWHGTAARHHGLLMRGLVWKVGDQSRQLAAAALAVERFAQALDDLQPRARRITEQAAAAGLELHEDGWVAPLPPAGPDPAAISAQSSRWRLREQVMAAAMALREEEQAAHAWLARELAAVRGVRHVDETGAEAWWWGPTRDHAPGLALSGGQLAAEVRSKGPALLRGGGVTTALGAGYGVATDIRQGRDLDDALTRNTVIAGAAVGGVAIGGVVVAAAALPVVAGAVAVTAAGVGASLAAGKAFDLVGHHLPWVDPPPARQASSPAGRGANRQAGGAARRPQPQPGPQPAPQPRS